jgi:branched-chain amino acid transport system substrate-binding protein
MSRHLTDEMIDAQLIAYLHDRAEDGAARAQTPEHVATAMAHRLRPSHRAPLGSARVLRSALLVVVAALLLLALWAWSLAGGRLPSVFPTRVVKIAIELPLGGSEPSAESVANGIKLAVEDARGRTGQIRIEVPESAILSDVLDGLPDPDQGVGNMRHIVGDAAVVAVIGPFNSYVAQAQIPISNAAGLLQCSPATTDPQLTRSADSGIPSAGSPAPGQRNYIRVVTTDDVAAAGAAHFVLERLGKTSVLVVDDDQDPGRAMADWFQDEFRRLGGSIVSRSSLPDSAAATSAMLASALAKRPQAIYFGGTGDRAAMLLNAAVNAGMGGIPFVGSDGLNDGDAARPGSFLSLVGEGAQHAYSVFPGSVNGPGEAAFEARYRTSYGADPTPFAALAYACAQVVVAALQQTEADHGLSAIGIRDAVRAAGVDTSTTFETILGPIAFDTRGDVTPKRLTLYAFDSATSDWVYSDQIDAAGVGR